MKNLVCLFSIVILILSCKEGTPPQHIPIQVVVMESVNEDIKTDLQNLNSILEPDATCKTSRGIIIPDLSLLFPESQKNEIIKINVNKDGLFDRGNKPITKPKVLKNVIDKFYETYSVTEMDEKRNENDFSSLLNKSQLKGKVTLVYNETSEFDSVCIGDIMVKVHRSLDSIRNEIQKAFCDDKTTSFSLVYNPIKDNYGNCKFKDQVVVTINPVDEEDNPDTEETITSRRKSGGKKKYDPKHEPVRVPVNDTQTQGKVIDLSKVRKTDIQNNTISGKDTKSN